MTVSENYKSNCRLYTVLIVILYALLFYYGLGRLGLMDNNEGLYAEIPREMLATGDFIIPHLNGVPYIEKPPLLYWMTAVSYLVFGFNEFAARFIPATSGLLTGLLLMHFLIIKARPSQAVLTGLMWGTSLGVTVFARVIFFDMLMTFMLTWAMTSFFLWFDTRRKNYLYQAYIATALGILTKGLLAFILPAGIVILFLVLSFDSHTSHSTDRWSYQKHEVKLILDPLCICLFLIIVLPWHLIAFYRDNNFLWFYFVNEHILRFIGHRVPHDYYSGPPYFYVSRLVVYLFPWTLFLLLFIWPRSSVDIHESQTIDRRLKIFLWIWFAVFMLFFTISEAKANYYIVTAFPPVLMLVADGIHARARLFRAYIFPAIFSFLLIFLIATIWILTAGVVPVLHPYKDMLPGWLIWPISL